MKLPRILIIAGLAFAAASAAVSPASAQTIWYGPPREVGFRYIYYTDWTQTEVVAENWNHCDGVTTWQGYNGNPDMTISQDYDYLEWNC